MSRSETSEATSSVVSLVGVIVMRGREVTDRARVAGMHRRPSALLMATALAALAACGSSSARTGATSTGPTTTGQPASVAHCAPAGARVMAADRRVQVYALRGAVYGCDVSGKRVRLGNASLCVGAVRVDHAAVAGGLIAYGSDRCGVDTGTASVAVLRLPDQQELHRFAAITGAVGPESYQSIDSLVLQSGGSIAWIATVQSIIGHRKNNEVHANGKLLDSGSGIAPSSLRLVGSKLTWRDGSAIRSATLR